MHKSPLGHSSRGEKTRWYIHFYNENFLLVLSRWFCYWQHCSSPCRASSCQRTEQVPSWEQGSLLLGRSRICALDQSQCHSEWQEKPTEPFSRLPIHPVCSSLTGSPNPWKLWVLRKWQEETTDLTWEWLCATVYGLSHTRHNHNICKNWTGGIWVRGRKNRDSKWGPTLWRWREQAGLS